MEQKTMKACVMHGPNDLRIDDMPVPQLLSPTDAIVKVTLTTMCTSDVHCARGHLGFTKPMITGHEYCGTVVEVGADVKNFKPGDRCLVYPAYFCGECFLCQSGQVAICQNGGNLGIGHGPEGCFAEYCLVNWADRMLIPIPGNLTEEDVIMAADVLPTGRFAVTQGEVKKGDTVAVFGVGPIGMAACLFAKQFGASKVIAVDVVQDRLDAALKHGICDHIINSANENPVQQVQALTGMGVDVAIETAGLDVTINNALEATKIRGTFSSISVIVRPVTVSWMWIQSKNLTVRAGTQCFEGMSEIIQDIADGKLDVKWMATHKKPLNNILDAYQVFGNHEDGCIKWLVTPYDHTLGS